MATKAPPSVITATLDTGNKTSDSFLAARPFDVAVRGTFVANIRLQQTRDEGANWDDLHVFTEAQLARVEPSIATTYRLTMAGVGDFGSGSATIFIG